GPVPVAVNLTVSDATLLDGGHAPGWIAGYGPVPAGVARNLVATALAEAQATLRRLYTTSTGSLVAMDSRSRTFPAALALFIDLRDQSCRTPWCDAPIRHRDHVVPDHAGGHTSAGNGQGLCEACNQAKEAPGFVATARDGVVTTTTPTGHRVRSRAPALPPGDPPAEQEPRRLSPEVQIYRPHLRVVLADDYRAA
ncbi:HNH endonuclease, partial [uncultured Nocardioides sp.]|uniref:HNH endonuclease n=1 Tax=uncultured Nocardioides sp. TaxID=198441 RepID=UPI0030F8A3D2